MIEIHLVCGFLGSGKTTLLKEVARRYPKRRWVFLVNEFASVGVDSMALKDCGVPIMEVLGGSLFCRCRVEQFIKELKALPEAFAEAEAVFVETSGMADPRSIRDLLRECKLEQQFRLAQVICIVSPQRFMAVVDSLPVVQAQVEAASRVILNQVDLCSEEELTAARDRIEQLRPGMEVSEGCYCRVDGLTGGGELTEELHGELSVDPNPFSSFELELKTSTNPDVLASRLRGLGPGVYRAKGVIQTPEGPMVFDWKGDEDFRAECIRGECVLAKLVVLVDEAYEEVLRKKVQGLLE